jgi:hypothetical protein
MRAQRRKEAVDDATLAFLDLVACRLQVIVDAVPRNAA